MTPLRQYTVALRALRDAREENINPVWRNGYAMLGWLAKARNDYRRAAIRLALSAAVYTVVALFAVAFVWALVVLAVAIHDRANPAPTVTITNLQLPTE